MTNASLGALLRTHAEARGLLPARAALTPACAFELVRDMPYQRASSRDPEVVIREWRGTCSGKHYLLKALFDELGLDAQLVMCTHAFTEANAPHFPVSLRTELAVAPVPDVHTFVRLHTGAGWTDVDATWPAWTERLGMPVNERFESGRSMRIACEPVEVLEVPEGIDPHVFKERLIESHCGAAAGRRDRFIESLSQWLLSEAHTVPHQEA